MLWTIRDCCQLTSHLSSSRHLSLTTLQSFPRDVPFLHFRCIGLVRRRTEGASKNPLHESKADHPHNLPLVEPRAGVAVCTRSLRSEVKPIAQALTGRRGGSGSGGISERVRGFHLPALDISLRQELCNSSRGLKNSRLVTDSAAYSRNNLHPSNNHFLFLLPKVN